MSDPLIVTKNESLIAWLNDKGIKAPVLEYAIPADVAHKHVYGLVPYWMAAYADVVSEVSMPHLDRLDPGTAAYELLHRSQHLDHRWSSH